MGFGGWDKGTWGLGVGLGNYPLGLGQGDLGFSGIDLKQPFKFWGLGQGTRDLGWDKAARV